MGRRWTAILAVIVLGAGCSSSERARDAVTVSSPSRSTFTTSSMSAQPVTTAAAVEMQPEDVAAALRSVTGADPVLVPTDVPSGWTAAVSVEPNTFRVVYQGLGGERVELSISVPNPPPPEADGSQQLGFRGDPHGLYQQQTSAPRSQRFLVWNEPGSWAGEPSIASSVRPDDVPYFVAATGMTDADFMRIVGSLSAVSHDARLEAPSVAVSPSQQLHDGQSVQVTLSGFGSDHRVRLSECASKDSVTAVGCGEQLARQPFVDLDATGAGSTTFVVHENAPVKPLDTTATLECADQCVLVATTDLPGSMPAIAPLAFE